MFGLGYEVMDGALAQRVALATLKRPRARTNIELVLRFV